MLVRPLKRKRGKANTEHLLRACRLGYNARWLDATVHLYRPDTESQFAFEVGFWWKQYPGSLWPDSYVVKQPKDGKRLIIINDVELIMDLETRQIEAATEGDCTKRD